MNSNRAANPMSGPNPWVNSRPADRQAPRLRELDLNSLPYVPLPCAPLRWGTPSARAHSQMQEAEALFEIRDAPWQLASIEKLVTDAYFAPDAHMLETLEAAAQRGADVRLLVPERTIGPATRSLYSDLLRARVRIYQ